MGGGRIVVLSDKFSSDDLAEWTNILDISSGVFEGSTSVVVSGGVCRITITRTGGTGSIVAGRVKDDSYQGDFDMMVKLDWFTNPSAGSGFIRLDAFDNAGLTVPATGQFGVFMTWLGSDVSNGTLQFAKRVNGVNTQIGTNTTNVDSSVIFFRITRVGQVFTSFTSADGISYTQDETVDLTADSIPATLFAALEMATNVNHTIRIDYDDFTIQQQEVTEDETITKLGDGIGDLAINGATVTMNVSGWEELISSSASNGSIGPFSGVAPRFNSALGLGGGLAITSVTVTPGSGTINDTITVVAITDDSADSSFCTIGGKCIAGDQALVVGGVEHTYIFEARVLPIGTNQEVKVEVRSGTVCTVDTSETVTIADTGAYPMTDMLVLVRSTLRADAAITGPPLSVATEDIFIGTEEAPYVVRNGPALVVIPGETGTDPEAVGVAADQQLIDIFVVVIPELQQKVDSRDDTYVFESQKLIDAVYDSLITDITLNQGIDGFLRPVITANAVRNIEELGKTPKYAGAILIEIKHSTIAGT